MTAEQIFRQLAAEKILIFDGGYGTSIQKHGLTEADYRGTLDLPKDQKGNNDLLCLTRPDIVEGIHAAYLEAGADMIETNTCLLYTSPSPRDRQKSRMPSSA